jgi:hypothetical protein
MPFAVSGDQLERLSVISKIGELLLTWLFRDSRQQRRIGLAECTLWPICFLTIHDSEGYNISVTLFTVKQYQDTSDFDRTFARSYFVLHILHSSHTDDDQLPQQDLRKASGRIHSFALRG